MVAFYQDRLEIEVSIQDIENVAEAETRAQRFVEVNSISTRHLVIDITTKAGDVPCADCLLLRFEDHKETFVQENELEDKCVDEALGQKIE
ncbi:hypothetical protein HPP92_029014 [Vanilla planifolia]|uniref:Uncharacterized protein n=1 Tax=Vanilla planifolia TaxID=51239 RepID=A0A835U2M8_VANPL|nr:hypothetical protein HPP92_029002 [Vanilla planifolia]KAG0446095.1 hypothetical protein HPP92_029014 [Vanilla planifolia]